MKITNVDLQEGVFLSSCKTDMFKSALMTVTFAIPLDAETASGFSLLTNMLSLCTGKYPSMKSFSVIKDELYALGLDAYVQRRGELLLLRLEISTIADSYAFDGEKVLERATELLGDAIFNPHLEDGAFPRDSVENEKLCLIEEIASRIENKPSYALLRARQIMCEGEPFSVDVGGEIDRVEKLDGSMLLDFYKKAINDYPVLITYAGEADADHVEECVRKNLPFKKRSFNIPAPVIHENRGEVIRVFEEMEMEQSVLILGFTHDMADTPEKRAALTVFDEIFGGSSASKLFMNVREKEGLCYYCSSYPSAGKNVLFVSCGLEPKTENLATDAIIRQVDAMKSGDFSETDIENAKRSIIRNLDSVGGGLGSITGYLLSQKLNSNPVTLEESKALISKVTREDITAFAQSVVPELIYVLAEEATE
jgi:predicted Zn-dependent peptidase